MAGGAGGSATRGRHPTPRPCGDPADADEAGISLGPTRKPMTSVPSAGRGKRPAPMTRLTAPAEPDVLATLPRTVADAACTPDGVVYASVSLVLQRRQVETPVYSDERAP